MAAFNKIPGLAAAMPNGVINLLSDTVKLMLTNTAPVAANNVYADISANEIANGNGYLTGGVALTLGSSSQVGGVYKYIATAPAPTWTAGPASMPTFRYIVAYDTAGVKQLLGWWDFGSPGLTLANTNTFTITLDAVNGILQLA